MTNVFDATTYATFSNITEIDKRRETKLHARAAVVAGMVSNILDEGPEVPFVTQYSAKDRNILVQFVCQVE